MAAGESLLRFRVLEWKPTGRGKVVGQVRVVVGGVLEFPALVVFRRKAGGYFCGLPSRPIMSQSGEKKYLPLVKWVDREAGDRFSDAVVGYLLKEFPETFEEEKDKVGVYEEIEDIPF